MMNNWFNLIDEPWIPIVDIGLVSLKDIFTNANYKALAGNPVQKIVLTKLLLAIAQSANTPTDDNDWKKLTYAGMAKSCVDYLAKWYEKFYLYGDSPFLQIPAIKKAKVQEFGALIPHIATGNTTIYLQSQQIKQLSDAEKALLIVELISFALGGKKTDNSIILSNNNYTAKFNDKGKPKSGGSGPALGFMGYLHNFLLGDSIQKSIWLNLLTQSTIKQNKLWEKGKGIAPWEQMPSSENDNIAIDLTKSLMGRLVPLNRFMLLTNDGIHYSEGIIHLSYKDQMIDPSMALNNTKPNEPKVLWANAEKRPWRSLVALLEFINHNNSTNSFNCLYLSTGLERANEFVDDIGVWSGGLGVSSNAGEQYTTGSDDYVESQIFLSEENLGSNSFNLLSNEMKELDNLSKILYGCVLKYYDAQKVAGKSIAGQTTNQFWQLAEQYFQPLIDDILDSKQRYIYRQKYASLLNQTYNQFCPQDTARQFETWVKCMPNLKLYLKKEENDHG